MIGTTFVTDEQFAALDRLTPRDGSFLEVGTAAGITTAKMATPGRTVVCVDTFVDLDHPDVVNLDGDRWTAWRLNTPPSVRLWRGDLYSFRRMCSFVFDVTFIDADHRHPHVGFDLADAAGGTRILCVHDYQDKAWPDVTPAVDEFCRRYGWQIADRVGTLAVLRRAI